MSYSDATKQVLELALDRLAADPSFPPTVLAGLRKLVEQGVFQDMNRVLAAIEQASVPANEAAGDAD